MCIFYVTSCKTKDKKEIEIKTSLTSEQVEKLIKEFEEEEKAKKALDKLFGILKTNKSIEELREEVYELKDSIKH